MNSYSFLLCLLCLKGPAHSKNENFYFLAPAQTKRMQPILVSCEAPFRRILQKKTIDLIFTLYFHFSFSVMRSTVSEQFEKRHWSIFHFQFSFSIFIFGMHRPFKANSAKVKWNSSQYIKIIVGCSATSHWKGRWQ